MSLNKFSNFIPIDSIPPPLFLYITKSRIAKIYEDYNNLFGNKVIFKKDWNNEMGDVIADICYEHTADNYDVTIFHLCPELAAPVFR